MNFSELPTPPPSSTQRVSQEAPEKDAKFLSFKLLNKRARVRLSPLPFVEQPPLGTHLFAVANIAGSFAAVIQQSDTDFALVFSSLLELRAAFSSSGSSEEIQFKPQRVVPVPRTPTTVTFASDDTRLLLGLSSGAVLIYDTSPLFSVEAGEIEPIHTWPIDAPNSLRQILPNPGDSSDQVAILRGSDARKIIEIIDVRKLETIGGWLTPSLSTPVPAFITWSPKGKQLAVGLQDGSILAFTPTTTSTPKLHVPAPSFSSPHNLLSITWLTSPTFHEVFSPASSPDPEQSHFIVTCNTNANSVEDFKLLSPTYFIAGSALNPFPLVLRNWDPAKVIVIVGDSGSCDIGVVGLIDDTWCNFILEETGTPRMPLDNDGNETSLTALEIDLTNDHPSIVNVEGEDRQIPSPPVMFAYASDGTVQAWYIVNSMGVPFPRSVIPAVRRKDVNSASTTTNVILSPQLNSTHLPSQQALMNQANTSSKHSPSNTSEEPLQEYEGIPLSGGQFRSIPFGQPAFGQPPVFSKPTVFEGKAATLPGVGFSAFASTAPVKFGQSSPEISSARESSQPLQPVVDKLDIPAFTSLSLSGHSDSRAPAQGSSASAAIKSSQGFGQSGRPHASEPADGPADTAKGHQLGSKVDFRPQSKEASSTGNDETEQSSDRNQRISAVPLSPGPSVVPAPKQDSTPAGSLKAFLKPASGFGAFGSDVKATSSPFFNPKTKLPGHDFSVTLQPSMGPSISAIPSKVGPADPVFGAASRLGSAKSMFGPVAPQGPHGGTSSGFAAFAGQWKSYGDLPKGKPALGSSASPRPGESTTQTQTVVLDSVTKVTSDGRTALDSTVPILIAPSPLPASSPAPLSAAKNSVEPAVTANRDESVTVPKASSAKLTGRDGSHNADVVESPPSDAHKWPDREPSRGTTSLMSAPGTRGLSGEPPISENVTSLETSPFPDTPGAHSDGDSEEERTDDAQSFLSDSESDESDSSGEKQSTGGENNLPSTSPDDSSSRSLSTTPMANVQTTQQFNASVFSSPKTMLMDLGRSPKSVARSSPLRISSIHGDDDQADHRPTPPSDLTSNVASPAGTSIVPRTSVKIEESGPSERKVGQPKRPPVVATVATPIAPTLNRVISTHSSPLSFKPSDSSVSESHNQPPLSRSPSSLSSHSNAMIDGLQGECSGLLLSLNREFDGLKLFEQESSQRRAELGHTLSDSVTVGITGRLDSVLRSLTGFGHAIKQLELDHAQNPYHADQFKLLDELQGHMLKGETRKEEILRFENANSENDFAQMLKMRAVSFDHLETRSQLRKDVAAMRDRIQKLEDHLYASKGKLNRLKTANPGFKIPPIDTVNRTYRNLDIALNKQEAEIAELTSRLTSLNLAISTTTSTTRDAPSLDMISPSSIVPHFATTTAAALNTERFVQRLKYALIARKEPLFTAKAASTAGSEKARDLRLDKDTRSSISSSSLTRRPTAVKHHSRPIALKRGPTTGLCPPAAHFDWGPLPTIQPMTTISIDVRKTHPTPGK